MPQQQHQTEDINGEEDEGNGNVDQCANLFRRQSQFLVESHENDSGFITESTLFIVWAMEWSKGASSNT